MLQQNSLLYIDSNLESQKGPMKHLYVLLLKLTSFNFEVFKELQNFKQ